MAPLIRSIEAGERYGILRKCLERDRAREETGAWVALVDDGLGAKLRGCAAESGIGANLEPVIEGGQGVNAASLAAVRAACTHCAIWRASALTATAPIPVTGRSDRAGGPGCARSSGADSDQAERRIVELGTVDR